MALDDEWLGATPGPGMEAVAVSAYRFDGEADYEALPAVRCLGVHRAEAQPGTASFRYDLDPRSDGPHSVEEALSTASVAPGLVKPGDRLAVFARNPTTGEDEPLFDGFVLDFAMHLAGRTEDVTFSAVGVAVRCWDNPVGGQLLRQGDQATAAGADVQTDLPAHFNPRGVPNATPKDADTTTDGLDHPVFFDPLIVRDPDERRKWTLPMAVRYLLGTRTDKDYVADPIGDPDDYCDALLVSREPKDGSTYDPEDSSTYDAADLVAPDMPITGRDWPGVLKALIGHAGFSYAFRLRWSGDVQETDLDLFHPQFGEPKDVYLQARGSTLDVTLSNVAEARLARDLGQVVNSWSVEGALKRYEASFVLAPGFPAAAGDATGTNLKNFDRNSTGFATYRDAYRLYVFDETGEGHYAVGTAVPDTTVVNLDALFGTGQWARRRRRPLGDLITRDSNGIPLRYQLAISTDYAGAEPGLWDGTGTWQAVGGGYQLLHDRLGVRIGVDNPNAWTIGKSDVSGAPYRQGVVKGVEAQATVASGTNFHLRLTCVVEGDRVVSYQSARSDRSPLPYQVARRVDARDRYRYEAIAAHSENNDTTDPVVSRDDSADIEAEATALQLATEAGILDGELVIPYFTMEYEVGDRIRSIDGRNLGLRTDSGESVGVAVYPTVVAVRWELGRGQRTVLSLSDAATQRASLRRSMGSARHAHHRGGGGGGGDHHV